MNDFRTLVGAFIHFRANVLLIIYTFSTTQFSVILAKRTLQSCLLHSHIGISEYFSMTYIIAFELIITSFQGNYSKCLLICHISLPIGYLTVLCYFNPRRIDVNIYILPFTVFTLRESKCEL